MVKIKDVENSPFDHVKEDNLPDTVSLVIMRFG